MYAYCAKVFIGREDSSGADHAVSQYPSLRDRAIEALCEKDVLILRYVRCIVHGNFDTACLRQVQHRCFTRTSLNRSL